MALFKAIYNILWGDLIQIPLPGGSVLGLSLLVLILVPAGLYFTVRTHFLPFRLFPEMMKVTLEKNKKDDSDAISGVQALIVSTACRVGMGNLVGVVAAISAGGAGAVFWMWILALLGSSTAFVESTLAQIYKEKDPLYGGYRGGPAYYLHHLFVKKESRKKRSVIASLFALSGLMCWCGISQVTSNSITSSFQNAFYIPPLYTAIALVIVAGVIVLRKNATVKVLDVIVPIMAACYFFITIFIILKNAGQLPAVFVRIFSEAFGFRQVVSGGIGVVIMNGAKRGLFSNEAGSGSSPCAAAAAQASHPAKVGLLPCYRDFPFYYTVCSKVCNPLSLSLPLSFAYSAVKYFFAFRQKFLYKILGLFIIRKKHDKNISKYFCLPFFKVGHIVFVMPPIGNTGSVITGNQRVGHGCILIKNGKENIADCQIAVSLGFKQILCLKGFLHACTIQGICLRKGLSPGKIP